MTKQYDTVVQAVIASLLEVAATGSGADVVDHVNLLAQAWGVALPAEDDE